MDKLSAERRSFNMSRIRSVDSKPELILRRQLHAAGYRYRLHVSNLPGRPDIVLPKRRKIIFVHGCFWHQHTGCPDGRTPRSRPEYWEPKLKRNRERDAAAIELLQSQGWRVMIVWECEVGNPDTLCRIRRFLD